MIEDTVIVEDTVKFDKSSMPYRIKSKELDSLKTNEYLPYDGNTILLLDCVGKFKSVNRACKRGHIGKHGLIYPTRPFNNRKTGPMQEDKKKIYKSFKEYGKRISA